MSKPATYRQRLARAAASAPRITVLDPEMQARQKLDEIRAKAAAYVTNNPQPRAMYLLGE